MLIIEPPQSAEEYANYYDLRWRILRAPWDQPRGSERDEFEPTAQHLCARDDQGKLLGVARLHMADPLTGCLRYMAVEESSRGQGVGRALCQAIEQHARDRGATSLILNARAGAVGFYERLGYSITGEGHRLFGVIPHKQMVKALAD